jgi:hypothetical protein
MDYLPPVVIEQVRPSGLHMGWTVPGIHFRREERSVGIDYDSTAGFLVGGRYSDTAHTATGAVHDNRWTFKVEFHF